MVVMDIWHLLGTLISATGLMVMFWGKEIISPEGNVLGKVVDIKLDLTKSKIWMIIDDQEHWFMVPSEKITSMFR